MDGPEEVEEWFHLQVEVYKCSSHVSKLVSQLLHTIPSVPVGIHKLIITTIDVIYSSVTCSGLRMIFCSRTDSRCTLIVKVQKQSQAADQLPMKTLLFKCPTLIRFTSSRWFECDDDHRSLWWFLLLRIQLRHQIRQMLCTKLQVRYH